RRADDEVLDPHRRALDLEQRAEGEGLVGGDAGAVDHELVGRDFQVSGGRQVDQFVSARRDHEGGPVDGETNDSVTPYALLGEREVAGEVDADAACRDVQLHALAGE